MNQIKMLQQGFGTDVDHKGVSMKPKTYRKDKVFQVVPKGAHPEENQIGEELAAVFCDHLKIAERMDESSDESQGDASEEKQLDGAPENKAEGRGSKRRR